MMFLWQLGAGQFRKCGEDIRDIDERVCHNPGRYDPGTVHDKGLADSLLNGPALFRAIVRGVDQDCVLPDSRLFEKCPFL